MIVVAIIPLLLLIALAVNWAYYDSEYVDTVCHYLRSGGSGSITTAYFFLIIAIIASLMAAMELVGFSLEPPISTFLPAALMVSILLVVIFFAIGMGADEFEVFDFGAGFYITIVALVLSVIYFIQPLFEGKGLFDR